MPSTMWGGIAGAIGKAQSLADDREQKKRERADAKDQRNITMAAALAGLSGQGISQTSAPGAMPLSDTGYFQDPTRTPQALAKTAADFKRSQRVSILRRNPDLAGYDDASLSAIADDEPTFEKWAAPKPPKKQKVMLDEKGKPVIVDADNPTLPPDFVGPHATPQNPASIAGSPEWKAAQTFTAGLGRESHEANRNYDVAHPMPQQDTGKMTEFSNKAALVYPRAAQAAAVLDPFFESGVPAMSLLGRATLGQYGVPAEIQRANQAAETISSAILRLESGAAISEHEVKEYAKQFLPQPGDSKAVLAQKHETLKTQLERMRQAASPTMTRDKAPTGPTADGAPPASPHVQTIDEMIKAGKSDAEIKAALKGSKGRVP